MDEKGFELLMSAKILGKGGGGMPMDAEGFERLMAAKILGKSDGGKIKELEGVPPLTFTAKGQPLLDYRIYGNTVQNGTPTPENPIMPIGCGELETTGVHAGQYKLPILSNATVTNIYLGEAETTRRIKKLVLTGEENWSSAYSGNNMFFYILLSRVYNTNGFMSHFVQASIGSQTTTIGYSILNDGMLRVRPNNPSTMGVAGFKSYLADQCAAGTPVTVWYVLAEPETGIMNEPLMKIGDYADTVSMEQAGVSIPTNKGSTTLDVDTTIKPSNVYIKYKS